MDIIRFCVFVLEQIKVASLPLQNFSISLGLAQQPELPTQPTASETGEKKEKNVNRYIDGNSCKPMWSLIVLYVLPEP